MDVVEHNRNAWNDEALEDCRWCIPYGPNIIAEARTGQWAVYLTPNRPVPRDWFPNDLTGKKVLCLASGGGQQAPLLAAVGAEVTSFDNAEQQLERDRQVAEREGLTLETIRGDMADLSVLADETFDLIINVTSNVFAPDLHPIWRECYRVLKPGGSLMVGMVNPFYFLFDQEEGEETGEFVAKYPIPYSDIEHMPKDRLEKAIADNDVLEFSHTLDDQIGGQLEAGFLIAGFFEDDWDEESTLLNKFGCMFINTRAIKPEW